MGAVEDTGQLGGAVRVGVVRDGLGVQGEGRWIVGVGCGRKRVGDDEYIADDRARTVFHNGGAVERVECADDIRGAVGMVGGGEAAAIVVAVGGGDAALPFPGQEAASRGVGVVGVRGAVVGLPAVIFLGEEAAVRAVDPGGDGGVGCCPVCGEGFPAICVVVGVGGAVGLGSGGFLDAAVGEVCGGGDVGQCVGVRVQGVWGVDRDPPAANIVVEGGGAAAGVGDTGDNIGGGGQVSRGCGAGAGVGLGEGAVEGVVGV